MECVGIRDPPKVRVIGGSDGNLCFFFFPSGRLLGLLEIASHRSTSLVGSVRQRASTWRAVAPSRTMRYANMRGLRAAQRQRKDNALCLSLVLTARPVQCVRWASRRASRAESNRRLTLRSARAVLASEVDSFPIRK